MAVQPDTEGQRALVRARIVYTGLISMTVYHGPSAALPRHGQTPSSGEEIETQVLVPALEHTRAPPIPTTLDTRPTTLEYTRNPPRPT